jgi:hypothetical protein
MLRRENNFVRRRIMYVLESLESEKLRGKGNIKIARSELQNIVVGLESAIREGSQLIFIALHKILLEVNTLCKHSGLA